MSFGKDCGAFPIVEFVLGQELFLGSMLAVIKFNLFDLVNNITGVLFRESYSSYRLLVV